MLEEFHGIDHGDGTYTWQQLYGWGAMNVNVWLPSLSELVGATGIQDASKGTCLSAMQGMNTSIYYYADAQGGEQFAYFQQFNASGGGETIWNACNREQSWLRSSVESNNAYAWGTTNAERFDWGIATGFHAVHPAGETPNRI